ncbi:MAG TPA: Na/Pi symporter, partial [Acidobacteriota bacterium]|nr:Na/Pi symporter [Acidobacteriota bacterium]
MRAMIFELAAGIGLFLVGMALLTDGLKSFAGHALRRALLHFTGNRLAAFLSGVLVTAAVQSSSATTISVIGLVSAGLLTFPQAVGVVMGASVGTTTTGWLVSILGLKFSVGYFASPLIAIGAFMKLLARGRWKSFGTAIADFGLIFFGIGYLQEAMLDLSGVLNLASLSAPGLLQGLLMILIGLGMTIVMHSSSATVATTVVAMHTNAVNFEQGMLLVIGAAIGTTSTSALAAIGAGTPAKRTALAHIIFNLAAALIGILLLPLFSWGFGSAQPGSSPVGGAVGLAAFHTAFTLAGAAFFLPMIDRFSAGIERLLPEAEPALTAHLDSTVLSVPIVALEATREALVGIALESFAVMREGLRRVRSPFRETQMRLESAIEETQEFLAKIPPPPEDQPVADLFVAQIHAVDHLTRFASRLRPPSSLYAALSHPFLQAGIQRTLEVLELGSDGLQGMAGEGWLRTMEEKTREIAASYTQQRPGVLRETARGTWEPGLALNVLDAMRWLERVSFHAWRICHYLQTQEDMTERAAKPPEAIKEDSSGQT